MASVICPKCKQSVLSERMLDDKIKIIDHVRLDGGLCKGSRSKVK